MKTNFVWIRKNWAIVIASVGVLITIDIFIHVWLFAGFTVGISRPNAELFNNLVTPLAALLSAILFVGLTRRQTALMQSQNQMPYYEEKFKELKLRFDMRNEESPNPNLRYIPSHVWRTIWNVYGSLRQDSDFDTDLVRYNGGGRFDRSHLESRSYYHTLSALHFTFLDSGIAEFELIVDFIKELEDSKLHEDDVGLFKRKVRDQFVIGYLRVIEKCDRLELYPIPDLANATRKGEILYTEISKTQLRKHYDFFNEHLRDI